MVRFTQVGLRYPDPTRGGPIRGEGERETLRDLSFTLPQGSFTWLTGPSGAGKTSLLRLMQLALRPTRGEVEVLGVPLSRARRADLPKLRRRIGAVFQEFRLLPYLTAFDNVALPLRLAGRAEASLRPDVAEMLRWVGLEGREGALPQQLSGGEQQRVAIARAVVTRPALLVADEPTGNLDPAQAHRLLMLLAEMNRLGATVVVATHSRELIAQYPGHVMQMEAGRIVALDPWPYGPMEGPAAEMVAAEEPPSAAPALSTGFAPDLNAAPTVASTVAPLVTPAVTPIVALAEPEPEAGWVEDIPPDTLHDTMAETLSDTSPVWPEPVPVSEPVLEPVPEPVLDPVPEAPRAIPARLPVRRFRRSIWPSARRTAAHSDSGPDPLPPDGPADG